MSQKSRLLVNPPEQNTCGLSGYAHQRGVFVKKRVDDIACFNIVQFGSQVVATGEHGFSIHGPDFVGKAGVHFFVGNGL